MQTTAMTIKNVTLIGADGHLGPHILQALLSPEFSFSVTVLKRLSSKSPDNYPRLVKVTRIEDEVTDDQLQGVLKDEDAIIITTPGSLLEFHKLIARAAATAGVQRLIPADFGSVDSENELARELVPFYNDKRDFRLYLTELTKQYSDFSWTALVCGHFFYAGSMEFLHIRKEERTVDVLGDGDVKASYSSMEMVGEATARILHHSHDSRTKNQMLFVQSFLKTQLEIKDSLERVTSATWDVNKIDADEFVAAQKARMKKGGNDESQASEDLVWYLGALHADWSEREGFAMKLLGLGEENLDVVVKGALTA